MAPHTFHVIGSTPGEPDRSDDDADDSDARVSDAGDTGAGGDSSTSARWRRDTKPRQRLSLDAIVTAAMEIVTSEGLDAVTMRRVAQALNTGPASLYAHVRNKQDLHELLLEAAFEGVEIPEPDPDNWREQLKRIAIDLTQLMVEKPGIARIAMETLIPTSPAMLTTMDAMMGIVRCSGLPDEYVSYACDALALYCTASAYENSMWPSSEAGQLEAERRITEINAQLDAAPAGRLSHLRALRGMAQSDAGPRSFEFAIDMFIAGIAGIGAHDGTPPP